MGATIEIISGRYTGVGGSDVREEERIRDEAQTPGETPDRVVPLGSEHRAGSARDNDPHRPRGAPDLGGRIGHLSPGPGGDAGIGRDGSLRSPLAAPVRREERRPRDLPGRPSPRLRRGGPAPQARPHLDGLHFLR